MTKDEIIAKFIAAVEAKDAEAAQTIAVLNGMTYFDDKIKKVYLNERCQEIRIVGSDAGVVCVWAIT